MNATFGVFCAHHAEKKKLRIRHIKEYCITLSEESNGHCKRYILRSKHFRKVSCAKHEARRLLPPTFAQPKSGEPVLRPSRRKRYGNACYAGYVNGQKPNSWHCRKILTFRKENVNVIVNDRKLKGM